MYRNMKGLVTDVALTVIMIISQMGNDLLHSLSSSSSLFMILTIGMFTISDNFLISKFDLAFGRFLRLKSDINLKVKHRAGYI